MVIQHDFVDGACRHCGTKLELHEKMAQPCVPRWSGDDMRPEPARRQYAIEDYDVISARLDELRADRQTAINQADG